MSAKVKSAPAKKRVQRAKKPTDIPSLVRNWTAKEKQLALSSILNEFLSDHGKTLFPIKEARKTIGYLMPVIEARKAVNDLTTEYGREIQRRIDTPEDSIPIEELNAELEAEENRRLRGA